MRIRLEFKPEDMWVGVYWKRTRVGRATRAVIDVWICLVPTIPIHLRWWVGERAPLKWE